MVKDGVGTSASPRFWTCSRCGTSAKPERTVDGRREPLWVWKGEGVGWAAVPDGALWVAREERLGARRLPWREALRLRGV